MDQEMMIMDRALITILTIYAALIIPLGIVMIVRARKSKLPTMPVSRRKSEMVTHNLRDSTVTPTKDTEAGKRWAKIANNECPECSSKEHGFYRGPSGGMSTNIECGNPSCKQRFNVTPLIGIAERI